jgi:hypothetical protein
LGNKILTFLDNANCATAFSLVRWKTEDSECEVGPQKLAGSIQQNMYIRKLGLTALDHAEDDGINCERYRWVVG